MASNRPDVSFDTGQKWGDFLAGKVMSIANPKAALSQGIAALQQNSRWLQGDIKAELDEILSSSEFRALIFEIDQIR